MRHGTDDRNNGRDAGLGVLFLAAFPLVLWLFQGSAVVLVSAVIQFSLLVIALRMIARGQEITRAYDAARVARRPRMPRKLIGSGLIGVVVLILAGHNFQALTVPLMCGVTATLLSVLAFGPDPLTDKGVDDPEELQRIRNAALVTEAETMLAEAVTRIAGLGDADLTRRTESARDTIVRLMRAMGQDGDQLEKLKKPLMKVAQILNAEVLSLEQAWEGEDYLYARRRYVGKLAVLVEKFEDLAFKGGVRAGRDAFDMEADLLLERMRHDTAA